MKATPKRIYRAVVPPPPPRTYSTSKYFHIFYTTLFYLLYIALLGLILVTPGDAIRQALRNKQLYNVFVIAAAYFVTAFLAVLIYASRIYTTRSVLAAIPRGYIPVEEGDVKEKVRRVVKRGLERSAGVAWLARPRAMQCAQGTNALCLAEEIEERREHPKEARPKLAKRVLRILRRKKRQPTARETKTGSSGAGAGAGSEHHHDITACTDNLGHPVVCPMPLNSLNGEHKDDHGTHIWGPISHPGWSPPTSHDLPNLMYHAVIGELPHLVEAKVVALSGATEGNLGMLTRPVGMGLREYLHRLAEMGCLDLEPWGKGAGPEEGEEEDGYGGGGIVRWKEWLVDYEHARFSGEAVSEEAFRGLMSGFASLLRSIRGLDGQVAAEEDDDASDWDEGEAYSVHSKSTKSTHSAGSGEQSLHSRRSQRSFRSMDDRRSIQTTGTAGTAGTVEKREDIEPQVPSYLSSPLPQIYTPAPRTPSPRGDADRLERLEEVQSHDYEPVYQSMGYEMQDMANTPESVIKRSPPPQQQGQPEMAERIRLGVDRAPIHVETESIKSLQTDSEGGSVIRLEMTATRREREDDLVDRLQAPLQVPLPSSGNTSSLGSYQS